jgi:hypothetical protein
LHGHPSEPTVLLELAPHGVQVIGETISVSSLLKNPALHLQELWCDSDVVFAGQALHGVKVLEL